MCRPSFVNAVHDRVRPASGVDHVTSSRECRLCSICGERCFVLGFVKQRPARRRRRAADDSGKSRGEMFRAIEWRAFLREPIQSFWWFWSVCWCWRSMSSDVPQTFEGRRYCELRVRLGLSLDAMLATEDRELATSTSRDKLLPANGSVVDQRRGLNVIGGALAGLVVRGETPGEGFAVGGDREAVVRASGDTGGVRDICRCC